MLWLLAAALSPGGCSGGQGGDKELLEASELSLSSSARVQPCLMFQGGQIRKGWAGSSPKEEVDLKE